MKLWYPTEKVSELLDHVLKPVMQRSRSHIRGSSDFVKKFKEIKDVLKDAIMVTADVVSLYSSIPHVWLEALRRTFDGRVNKKIDTENLIKMVDFVLKNNYFEFNGEVKQQLSGTAIGTKFASPYPCMFMDQVETEFLQSQVYKPLVWFRYTDNVFFIWTHSQEKLMLYLEDLNKCHPNIKFTHETNKEDIFFLDLKVKFLDGKISTDLFLNSTDHHKFLHYISWRPEHNKGSIVLRQGLRLIRMCSYESDFVRHLSNMKSWFSERGYTPDLVESGTKKVKFTPNVNNTNRGKSVKGLPFVLTYQPKLKSLNKILH